MVQSVPFWGAEITYKSISRKKIFISVETSCSQAESLGTHCILEVDDQKTCSSLEKTIASDVHTKKFKSQEVHAITVQRNFAFHCADGSQNKKDSSSHDLCHRQLQKKTMKREATLTQTTNRHLPVIKLEPTPTQIIPCQQHFYQSNEKQRMLATISGACQVITSTVITLHLVASCPFPQDSPFPWTIWKKAALTVIESCTFSILTPILAQGSSIRALTHTTQVRSGGSQVFVGYGNHRAEPVAVLKRAPTLSDEQRQQRVGSRALSTSEL